MKKSDILKLVDRLMGTYESIHTVAPSWCAAIVSSKKMWCLSRRQEQFVLNQAVSSVAPSVCHYNHNIEKNITNNKSYKSREAKPHGGKAEQNKNFSTIYISPRHPLVKSVHKPM